MLTIDLNRISRISTQGQRVQNIACLINERSLKDAHATMDAKKATGVDRVTKEEYGQNLTKNLTALVNRMKGGTYTPNPSRRTYIDKPGTNTDQIITEINQSLIGSSDYISQYLRRMLMSYCEKPI